MINFTGVDHEKLLFSLWTKQMGKHLNSVKVEREQFLEIICKKTGGWQVRGFSAPGEVFPMPTYPVPPRFEIYGVPLQVLGQLPPLLGMFPRSVSCAMRMLVAFSIKPQGSHPRLPRGSHFKHTTLCIVLRRAETMLHFLEQQLLVHHQPRVCILTNPGKSPDDERQGRERAAAPGFEAGLSSGTRFAFMGQVSAILPGLVWSYPVTTITKYFSIVLYIFISDFKFYYVCATYTIDIACVKT